jgi:hypothetical protein
MLDIQFHQSIISIIHMSVVRQLLIICMLLIILTCAMDLMLSESLFARLLAFKLGFRSQIFNKTIN